MSRSPMSVMEEDLVVADRIVALKRDEHLPLLQERFPNWSENIEFWHVNDTEDAVKLIEREVMNLIARILGGGNRPEGALPDAPNSKPPVVREPPKKQITLKVGRETAGRKGKGVTTIFDMPLSEDAVLKLAATLKNRCGTGGTVKDGRIEIQGDQRERIIAELEKLGYKVKRVGG